MTISVPDSQAESRQTPLGSTVREFTDPYEYQSSIRATDVRFTITAAGKYRAKLTKVDLHRLWMQRGETSLPYIAHSAPRRDRSIISFLADTQQAPSRQNGLELLPGTILAGAPGSEFHRRAQGGRWGAMSLTLEDFAAAGQALVGRELTPPQATRIVRPPSHLMSRLLQLHEAAGKLAETVPDILAHPEVARAMEQALVQVMVECLTAMPVGDIQVHRHTRIPVMRRFEQVLEEHQERTLYVAEVCAKLGVSERTLRLHCQEHLEMSPHKYLWLRRMNLVRRALMLADHQVNTVTQVATDYGFYELGRFAVDYRKLFGEPPSVTLRRAPDHTPSAGGPAPLELGVKLT
jgi:AraC-like DNA-binding protein